jgi:hypothetical protein
MTHRPRQKPSAPKAVAFVAKDPSQGTGKFKQLGGSQSDDWNQQVFNDTVNTFWLKSSDDDTRDRQFNAAIAGLCGIAPKDELEGMMAAQLIASHCAAMECYRRAMLREQTAEGRCESLGQANKLSRTFGLLIDCLNRHRGKGQQKVTVEHVHVHSGGRAIVGAVEAPGGGDCPKTEDQPHAKQIAHAPQPALRSPDPAREPVPLSGDAERPLPNARRIVDGGAERE